jgi:hypothetical protein
VKKIIASATLGAMLAIMPVAAYATDATEPVCVPSEAYTEVIEHPAVTEERHIPAVYETVDYPAVTEEQTVPGKWWNFSPNKEQKRFEGPPAFPYDDRGTWQGPHTNGGPDQDAEGTFQQGNGNGSWFHREAATTVTVVIREAYSEQRLVSEARTVVVVVSEAYTETVEHPAVECPPDVPLPPDPEFKTVDRAVIDCEADFVATWRTELRADYTRINNVWVRGEFLPTGPEEQTGYREALDFECPPTVPEDPTPLPEVVDPPVTPEVPTAAPVNPAPVVDTAKPATLPVTGPREDALVNVGLAGLVLVLAGGIAFAVRKVVGR